MAVLTYLRRILESLDHPDMINLILHYLLALPDTLAPNEAGARSSVSLARKRKSMDLATMLASKSDMTVTPLLFNLVDLILACLRSRNQQTIHVTLQLVSAILKRHHRYAIITLLRTDIIPLANTRRTVGAHEQEVEYIMSLAGTIGGQDDFDDVYQMVLQDTLSRLESHPCSIKLVAPRVSASNPRVPTVADSLPGAPREVSDHTLRPDDPLLNALLDLLETFFINPVETNLSVTETLVDLAICGYMKVEGWLMRTPGTYTYDEDESTKPEKEEDDTAGTDGGDDLEMPLPLSPEEQHIKAMTRCRKRPRWVHGSLPRVLRVLKHLEEQVLSYKKTIPRFDELVQQRREAFQTADAMLTSAAPTQKATPAQQETPDHRSSEEIVRSGSPSRPSALEGLAHRLLSELGTPNRTSSPRGRKEQNRSSGSGSATPSKSVLAPKEVHNERISSPARSQSRSRVRGETEVRDDVVSSQIAAFAAIDQTILAKRVGLPEAKVDAIPLKFDKKPGPELTAAIDAEHAAPEQVAEQTGNTEEAAAAGSETTSEEAKAKEETKGGEPSTVSVSHIVTNVIILQSFLFELAGLVQVRAGLFDEVRFV